MPIRWQTWITDAEGVVDYDRVKSLCVVVAFVLACLVMLAGAVLEITRAAEVPVQMVVIAGTLLIAPITGAAFGGMLGKHLQASAVAKAMADAQRPADEPVPEG